MLVNTIHTWGKEIKETGVEEASMIHTEKMLEKNLNWDFITDITGVTQERYNQWKKSREAVMSDV